MGKGEGNVNVREGTASGMAPGRAPAGAPAAGGLDESEAARAVTVEAARALAESAGALRPGTTSPGASPPLLGAPAPGAPEAHACGGGQLRRSLRACTAEGIVTEVIGACAGGAALTAWALWLGAGPLFTGLLVALPQMAQLFQVPAAWTTRWLGHRRACLWMVGISRQVYLPLAALPLLPASPLRPALLLATAALAAVLGVLGNNAWVAWMGDLVPRRIRGRYFGRRSGLCMLGGALAAAGAGMMLDAARPHGLTAAALVALQVIASACGIVTVLLMRRQHDPAPGIDQTPAGLGAALAPFRDPALRGLLRYQVAWNLATGVAGSFYVLHMLKNLGMGYTLVALHGTATAASRMLAAPLWGRLLDRFGARPILLSCSFGIALVPWLWLFPTEGARWPLAIDALVAGALWGGHGLAVFALPLSLSARATRPFTIAAVSTSGGLAFAAATAIGGLLARALPDRVEMGGHVFFGLQALFVLSALLRIGAAALGLGVHEPRAQGVAALWASVGRALRGAAPIRLRSTD